MTNAKAQRRQAARAAAQIHDQLTNVTSGSEWTELPQELGLSRKVGLPNYGSLGASCALEMELEALTFHDPDSLQDRVQEAFAACRQAVEHELSKSPDTAVSTTADGDELEGAAESLPNSVRPSKPIVPLATQRQIDFAYHLAREIRSLGGQRLSVLVQQLYDRKIEELTSPEASRLIDVLKELRAGTRSVDDLLAGAAA